ncbi:MAG: DUF3795 domain-containing protein [Bacteroidota bacterium]
MIHPHRFDALSIAPCGMNCGICAARLRTIHRCPGCMSYGVDKPKHLAYCSIAHCPELEQQYARFCYECAQFPCPRLRALDKRYRMKYDMSMIDNLRSIREDGLEHFLSAENRRWECSGCGSVLCVHRPECPGCGALRQIHPIPSSL